MRTYQPVLVLLAALLSSLSARAQSTYDFTLINDPALCGTFCNTVVGSGSFTTSPTLFSSIQGSGYPILSLTGTFNGAAMSLGKVSGEGLGNLYYQSYLPISWFAPLYFSTSAGTSSIQQSDYDHPGTGQWLTDPGGKITYVSFVATPAPQPTAPAPKAPPIPTFTNTPPVFSSSGGPALSPRRTLTPSRTLNPVVIEISVPAAIALVTAIYEWRHHREQRYAFPAGRF